MERKEGSNMFYSQIGQFSEFQERTSDSLCWPRHPYLLTSLEGTKWSGTKSVLEQGTTPTVIENSTQIILFRFFLTYKMSEDLPTSFYLV